MAQYAQPRRKRRPKRRRARRRGTAAAFVLIAAVIIAIGFGISLFFKVGYVEVYGTRVCKNVDIIASSGIQSGDLLFFANKSTIIRNIMAEQPYVDTVSVRRKLPDIIQIEITESVPTAFVTLDDKFWMIDGKGKLLEKKSERPDLPEMTGFSLLIPVEGTIMEVGDSDSGKVKPLLQILGILKEREMSGDVQEIYYNDALGVSFRYLNRFTVKLGIPSDIEKKLEILPAVIDASEPNASGTIDLSNTDSKIYRFIPD